MKLPLLPIINLEKTIDHFDNNQQHQMTNILPSGLTTADPSASGLGSFSPKPLIVDEMFPRVQSPVSDLDTASGLSCSSEHSTGKTRKSSVPKRLRLGSEASSPGPEEEDGDKKEIEVSKYIHCLKIKYSLSHISKKLICPLSKDVIMGTFLFCL